MEDIWKSWPEIYHLTKGYGKKVILWGRSDDWLPKIIPKLKHVKDLYIVDQNPAYNNTYFMDIPVYLPERLEDEYKDDVYVIITGAVYDSISHDLKKLGYKPGINYCCSPEMKDWGILQEIREYNKNIIIACSDYKDKSKKRWSQMGGGIYTLNTRDNKLKKHIDGHFRQIINVDDFYYAIEFVEKKIYKISKDFKVIDKYDDHFEKPNACGIAYHPRTKTFFVANAGTDTIHIFNRSFDKVDDISISRKYEMYGDSQHHINDICIVGDQLLISCFSISGNWKKGIMDGGIVSIDINQLHRKPEVVVQGLWMPHSIEFINGNISYLDSMNGDFYITTQKIEGKFNGFIRGIAYDGRFYYIGQSEDMYTSRLFGIKDNIMCNAGVYLFDKETKVSRFYSCPFIMNVHDILIEE